jgi:hypothetical protein
VPLPGVATYSQAGPDQRHPFRNAWTQPEGGSGAFVQECQVTDINLKLWTVDVVTKFDQKQYLNIQIASPYMHFNQGEGFYAMPDIGAKCQVCIPSDGPPPFVLGFIMPQETIDGASADAPQGTDGQKGGVTQTATTASFAGGRKRAKPGDMGVASRDGSFVRLHRGGVLQIGASELAQRIYISLQNVITDISQNYRHQNTGGSVNWFISPGESVTNPPTTARYTYRVLANEEKATVRVAVGRVSDVLKEPLEEVRSDLTQLGIDGKSIVAEVIIAPETIAAEDGALGKDTPGASVLRYFFDKAGNALLRMEGSVVARVGKRLRLRVDDNVEVFGKKDMTMTFDGVGRLAAQGGLDLSGAVVRVNGGSKAVATVGSTVMMTVVAPIPITVVVAGVPSPGTILTGAVFSGVITSGNPTFLA